MPIMQVHYRADALDEVRKADLARRLTDVLMMMEGGGGTEGGRAFAWVLFSPVEPGDWWVGGQPGGEGITDAGRFLVHVTIPEGYMNAAQKTEVHRAVNDAIMAATAPAGSNADGAAQGGLVVIDEVTEGNWGAGGRTISLGAIARTVGLPETGARFAWIQSYFAAKRRQLDAAGYPADLGGVLRPSSGAAG